VAVHDLVFPIRLLAQQGDDFIDVVRVLSSSLGVFRRFDIFWLSVYRMDYVIKHGGDDER
jgi:hypothetical protein